MQKTRVTYFVAIIITIGIGLLSRHIRGVPLFVGDILWGLMVYFIMRFLLVKHQLAAAITAALLFSYGIEFSQLYQAGWIIRIRHTVVGGLVLGETFLWSDMLCYTIGIAIGVVIDRVAIYKKGLST